MPENHKQPDYVEETTKRTWRRLLRRSDQAMVACFVCVGLIGLACWMVRLGGGSGEAIDLDRAIDRRATFQIDMNQAEWVEWAELPGVGEGIARQVIESRENEGPFTSPEDLMRVKGIGPKTLEQIRPYIQPNPGTKNMVGTP